MKEVETKIRNFSSEVRERTIDILKTIEVDEHGEVYMVKCIKYWKHFLQK